MTIAEIYLFKKAREYGPYDYYHLLSGQDLLLVSNVEFYNFFEKNNGKEFIEFKNKQNEHDPEIKRRTRLYHFLQNYRRRFKLQLLNEIFIFFEICLLALQLFLHVNRVENLDWQIKYGSEWVSVTDDFVVTLLNNEAKIDKIFRWRNCSDELMIQTIAFNCRFVDRLYHNPNGADNMRLVDFDRGKNGSPYTFTVKDYDMLKNSNALIARKFSLDMDSKIVDRIIKETRYKRIG